MARSPSLTFREPHCPIHEMEQSVSQGVCGRTGSIHVRDTAQFRAPSELPVKVRSDFSCGFNTYHPHAAAQPAAARLCTHARGRMPVRGGPARTSQSLKRS